MANKPCVDEIGLMNKHKKSGWSQMRYNRLRSDAIKSLLTKVGRICKAGLILVRSKGWQWRVPEKPRASFAEMQPAEWRRSS